MTELADFVLDAIRVAGGIVEVPAYNIHEVLLPEDMARRWGVPAYERIAFGDQQPPAEHAGTGDVVVSGFGHPLVETLIEEVRANPACAIAYINNLRLDKRALAEPARQTLTVTNARIYEVPQTAETVALCQYVRFNLKTALMTDEKHERLLSVMMDVQSGCAVPELAWIERLARLEDLPALAHLPLAPLRWQAGGQALGQPVLARLLERATAAALDELAPPLEMMRRRAARYLELDRARLDSYYDDIEADLQRRIGRAGDEERRASLRDKLLAAQVERRSKLSDVEAKYRLRVELELVNLQVIVQPKILLPVTIGNRTATGQRTVVWDPLLRRIELLTCDVCGLPATRLTLCSSGHLAHEGCLLPEQCIDCKRVYCRLCANELGRCAVCNRPVCGHSLNRCAVCGRSTCREHVLLCHAADGQPMVWPPLEPTAQEPAAEEGTVGGPAPTPSERAAAPDRQEERKKRNAPARAAARQSPAMPKPFKVDVYAEPGEPVVNAVVSAKGGKELVWRTWALTDAGIEVTCRCEKWYRCPANETIVEPAGPPHIEAQIEAQVEELRREYGISARYVFRHVYLSGVWRGVPRVALRGEWKAR